MLMEEVHEASVGRDQLPEGNPSRRRRRRTATAVALALVGAGLALSAGVKDDGQGRVKLFTHPVPSATATVAPATTAPTTAVPDSAPPTVALAPDPAPPTTAAATKPTAKVPLSAAAPDRSRPAGMTYTPEAIWPETLAELDKLQAAVGRRGR